MFGLFKSKQQQQQPLTSILPNAATAPPATAPSVAPTPATAPSVAAPPATAPVPATQSTAPNTFLSRIKQGVQNTSQGLKNKMNKAANYIYYDDIYYDFFIKENTEGMINFFQKHTDENEMLDYLTQQLGIKNQRVSLKELREKYIKFLFSYNKRLFGFLRYIFNEYRKNNKDKQITMTDIINKTERSINVSDITDDYKMFIYSKKIYIYYRIPIPDYSPYIVYDIYNHYSKLAYPSDSKKYFMTFEVGNNITHYIESNIPWLSFVKNIFNDGQGNDTLSKYYKKMSNLDFYTTENGVSNYFSSKSIYSRITPHYTSGTINSIEYYKVEALHKIVLSDHIKFLNDTYDKLTPKQKDEMQLNFEFFPKKNEYFYSIIQKEYITREFYYVKEGEEMSNGGYYWINYRSWEGSFMKNKRIDNRNFGGKKSLKNKSKKYKKTTQKNKKRRRRTLKR